MQGSFSTSDSAEQEWSVRESTCKLIPAEKKHNNGYLHGTGTYNSTIRVIQESDKIKVSTAKDTEASFLDGQQVKEQATNFP